MNIKVHRDLAAAIGEKNLRDFQIEADTFKWHPIHEMDLRDYTGAELARFRKLVEAHVECRGGKTILKDLDVWKAAQEAPGQQKARSVKQMTTLVTEFIRTSPGHRIFSQDTNDPEAWLCYYVNEVEFVPEHRSRDGDYRPPYCRIEYVYEEFGGRFNSTESFGPDRCIGKTAAQMLAQSGNFLETPAMREKYLAEKERWRQLVPLIGMQFLAGGVGTDDLDGNDDDNNYRRSWRTADTIILEREGQKSRVVIDVYTESDKKEEAKRCEIDPWFWRTSKYKFLSKAAKADDDDEEFEDDEGNTEKPKKRKTKRIKVTKEEAELELQDEDEDPEFSIEIPVHPKLAVFDLKKHLRLRVHVNNLTEYVYDTNMHKKLVLPPENTGLVEMLLHNKDVFQDIVSGKSGGTIILCAGPPGTGKTLSAEVYAEATERPLFSVQASQLGLDAESLEKELMKVLARGKRWDAVMLIDEADVYVHTRGNDLTQNAIVGVFLRVLEYHASVLFLTTNRADLVDDAIASRCTARIEFGKPSIEDQKKIWRILADNSGIQIDDATIETTAKLHPTLSGRDVKNLLKLANLMSRSTGKPISAETVEYVLKFKPTTA